MIKNKIARIFIAFLIIYIAWSAYIDLTNLREHVDNEALIPCLIYLPPLGFLALGLLVLKVMQSTMFFRLIKKIFRRK